MLPYGATSSLAPNVMTAYCDRSFHRAIGDTRYSLHSDISHMVPHEAIVYETLTCIGIGGRGTANWINSATLCFV